MKVFEKGDSLVILITIQEIEAVIALLESQKPPSEILKEIKHFLINHLAS